MLDVEPDGVQIGALADHGEPVPEQLLELDGAHVELHPPGLDLRQVEDLVDQLEQVPPASRMSRT